MTKPALTPEEWSGEDNVVLGTTSPKLGHFVTLAETSVGLEVSVIGPSLFVLEADERHSFAALALHNQPFGFTREDVKWLRVYAGFRLGDDFLTDAERDHITGLAARIEALLPPEPVNGNE